MCNLNFDVDWRALPSIKYSLIINEGGLIGGMQLIQPIPIRASPSGFTTAKGNSRVLINCFLTCLH
jgi:hypothetical protein